MSARTPIPPDVIESAGACCNHGPHFGLGWPRWNGEVLILSVAEPFDPDLPRVIISGELRTASGDYVAGPWMPW